MAWKPANPQLELVLPAASASQFHPTAVEKPTRPARRSGSLIRQALYLDQEDAYAAGEAVPQALFGVGFLARALVQATLPHSDSKTNEFVRRNGHFTLSILAPKDVGLPFGRYPRLVLAYLTTEAVRRKSPDIELGSHFSHFCAALGIPSTTGRTRVADPHDAIEQEETFRLVRELRRQRGSAELRVVALEASLDGAREERPVDRGGRRPRHRRRESSRCGRR